MDYYTGNEKEWFMVMGKLPITCENSKLYNSITPVINMGC